LITTIGDGKNHLAIFLYNNLIKLHAHNMLLNHIYDTSFLHQVIHFGAYSFIG